MAIFILLGNLLVISGRSWLFLQLLYYQLKKANEKAILSF